MKHINFRQIGKKLAALSMAAVAAITLMLGTVTPMTANATDGKIYGPEDEIIPLPAPVYNWGNSKKVITFDVKKAASWWEGNITHVYGNEVSFLDKNGVNRTRNARFCYTRSGGRIEDHGKQLGTLTLIGDGWYHAEIEIWKLDVQPQANQYDPYLGLNPYLPNYKAKTQTLCYMKNMSSHIKNVHVEELVDPDRNVSRFHTNILNQNLLEYGVPDPDNVRMWKYSNKKIVFDLIPTDDHYYGNDYFTLYLQTIRPDGSWKSIANSIRIHVMGVDTSLNGSKVTFLDGQQNGKVLNLGRGGWIRIELPLNQFVVNNSQIENAGNATLDVVGFDWVNRSFKMRDFRIE